MKLAMANAPSCFSPLLPLSTVWMRPPWTISTTKNQQHHQNNPQSSGSAFLEPISIERRFPCSACGKSYKWRESLLKHLRIECGKPPRFCCEVCGNRFMHKHHLRKHRSAVHQISVIGDGIAGGADVVGYP